MPAKFCGEIIAAAQSLDFDQKTTLGSQDSERLDTVHRDVRFGFFRDREKFKQLYHTFSECLKMANQEHWKFHLTEMETLQYSEYGPGHHFEWHLDQFTKPFEGQPYDGLTRKLSMTIQLSSDDEYDGGDFEIRDYCNYNRIVSEPEARKFGSVIVFPSFIEHRVAPVTRGVRRSLVGWALGPPFV